MLNLIHSNRLEILARELIDRLDQDPPAPFEQEQILVQNPGMKRWLQQAVARRSGCAAALQFPLPSGFLWSLLRQQFDDLDDLSGWDAETLRWRLMRLLAELESDPVLAPLRPYLQRDQDGSRRWQLAQRLAQLFDQYPVYRPDLLSQWESGQSQGINDHEAWQALLWRRLREEQQEPPRHELIQRLICHLSEQDWIDGLPRRVSIFAISSLSRAYLEAFNALGRHCEVNLYHLNPCEHYWGDIRSRAESLRREGRDVSENELLASLGKQGREFIELLYEVAPNNPDKLLFEAPGGRHLLAGLQRQILSLETEEPLPLDDSIRFTACYSELREVQALRDFLLHRLQQDDSLQPHDIVVMHPDIDRIAPMVEAVFGGSGKPFLPWSLSDQRVLDTDPLIALLLDWLGLPDSRFSASELLGWLEVPALNRRLDFDEEDLERLRFWVRELHIHWARDGRHREELGLGRDDLYSWKQGLDRLLAAALMSDELDHYRGQPLPQLLPTQADIQRLGRLAAFLDDLWHWRDRLKTDTDPADWQRRLLELAGQMLEPDAADEARLSELRRQLENLRVQAATAGFEEPLSARWLRHFLEDALRQQQSSHRYLSGGISFSNLIPMRMLPFRVVCLLGMNDDDFPRRETPQQFDLIAARPRIGDRSRRDDDRYLFLQALLAAGDCFYISWVGRDRRDDSELEPSVVVSQLRDVIADLSGESPPVREIPLQAFSPASFEGEGSFAADWWPDPQAAEPKAFNQPVDLEVDVEGGTVHLEDFKSFFRNPAKYFLEQRLGMKLGVEQDEVDDEEPFALNGLAAWSLRKQLLDTQLNNEEPDPDLLLSSGLLPPGALGRQALARAEAQAGNLANALVEDPDYAGLLRLDFEYRAEGLTLQGQTTSHAKNKLLQVSVSSHKGSNLFPAWIDHCLFCCTREPSDGRVIFLDYNKTKIIDFRALKSSDAKKCIDDMIEAWNMGQSEALGFYPDFCWEYVNAYCRSEDRDTAWSKALSRWNGTYNGFHEAEDDYIRTILKPDSQPDEATMDWAEVLMLPLVEAMKT